MERPRSFTGFSPAARTELERYRSVYDCGIRAAWRLVHGPPEPAPDEATSGEP